LRTSPTYTSRQIAGAAENPTSNSTEVSGCSSQPSCEIASMHPDAASPLNRTRPAATARSRYSKRPIESHTSASRHCSRVSNTLHSVAHSHSAAS